MAAPRTTNLGVVSVVDLVYQELRARLLRGELTPGERLGQDELAAALGVSRTPVREALRRLTGEGIVEFRTNYGFSVAEMPVAGMLHRMEVRFCLEPHIAELAAERRTDEQLRALRGAVEQERAAGSGEVAAEGSRVFHMALADATGNDEFARVVGDLWIPDVGRWALSVRRESRRFQRADAAEHEQIAEAVANGDGARARQLMEQHLRNALVWWKPAAEHAERFAERDPSTETRDD